MRKDDMIAGLFGRERQEGPDSGQLSGRRGGPQPLGTTGGEECPQIAGRKAQKGRAIDGSAAMFAEQSDETVRRRDISANGMRGAAAIMGEIGRPARG